MTDLSPAAQAVCDAIRSRFLAIADELEKQAYEL